MPFCQNPHCRKQNLKKEDVEFDEDRKMVLCTGCYCVAHPGWVPPAQVEVLGLKPPLTDGGFQYDISLSSRNGFTAKASYNDLHFTFHASPDELKKLGIA